VNKDFQSEQDTSKISGGVQKLYFCMGPPEVAAVQKYNFCTPEQPENRIRKSVSRCSAPLLLPG
jgi:hypothetical protein